MCNKKLRKKQVKLGSIRSGRTSNFMDLISDGFRNEN